MNRNFLSYGMLLLSMVFALVTPPMIKQCCMEILEIETLFSKSAVGEDDCCKEEDNCCQPQFDQIDWQTDAITVSKVSFHPVLNVFTIPIGVDLFNRITQGSGIITPCQQQFPPGTKIALFKKIQTYLI